MNNQHEESTAESPASDDGTCHQVSQRHYDPGEDADLTTVIVSAIADGRGICPSEVKDPPLYQIVDAAAIEATFFGRDSTTSRVGSGAVEFQYEEYHITVQSDGWVLVNEATATPDTPDGDENGHR